MGNAFVIILIALFTIGISMLLYMSYEAANLEVTYLKYQTGGQVICPDDQTNYLPSCLIMHISDIHIKFLRVSPKKIANLIKENKPDIILLSGDYIENTRQIPLCIEFLKKSGIADKSSTAGNNRTTQIPCYGVFGNHDYDALKNDKEAYQGFIKTMKNNGLHILCDESIRFEKNGVVYNIIGLKDLREMKPDFIKAYSNIDTTAKMTIVVTHNPDTVLELPENKTDLVLAGHFHGGQIWLPFNLEYKTFRNEKLCMMGISRGMHNINNINIYINRGIGNVVVPMRFLSRPEILFIEVPDKGTEKSD